MPDLKSRFETLQAGLREISILLTESARIEEIHRTVDQLSADLRDIENDICRTSRGGQQLAPNTNNGTRDRPVDNPLPPSPSSILSEPRTPSELSSPRDVESSTNRELQNHGHIPVNPAPEAALPATWLSQTIAGSNIDLETTWKIPRYTITTAQMGSNLVPTLATIVSDPEFDGMLHISDLPEFDMEEVASKIKAPTDRSHLGLRCQPLGDGVSRVERYTPAKFKLPKWSAPVAKPSYTEVVDFLNKVGENPPDWTISYYVGPRITPGPDLLHPGEELLQLPTIEGVNTPYDHIGEKFSVTPFHSEDAEFWSINYVYFGFKPWILIDLCSTTQFEELIRRSAKTNECHQFGRHPSLYFSPERLQKEGIKFEILCAGPGDVVVPKRNQYHAIGNYTPCGAVSGNFVLPGETAIPQGLAVCEDCGLYNLRDQYPLKVVDAPAAICSGTPGKPTLERRSAAAVSNLSGRKGLPPARKLPPKRSAEGGFLPPKRPKSTRVQGMGDGLQDIRKQILKIDPLCRLPSAGSGQQPGEDVFRLAAAIGSRETIRQLCHLVHCRRDRDHDRIRLGLSQDLETRIGQHVGNIDKSKRKSSLEKLQVRLSQFYLAQDIDRYKKGRINADPRDLESILQQTGWTKRTLKMHCEIGNKWKRLCGGGNDGLLCLIFLDAQNPFKVSPSSYSELKDLKTFHSLLDGPYFRSLCSAASAFQQSLDSTSHDIEFRWEATYTSPDKAPEEDLLSLLKPLSSSSENRIDMMKYPDWPRPPGWPHGFSWPEDPTRIPGTDKQCDLCDSAKCECIRKNFGGNASLKPRIKDYGNVGRGLQAVARKEGEVAYKAGAIIGFLAGDIVPLGSYDDDRALQFVRPDLDDEPAVCQILCTEGNCFRLLNHSCRPCAEFEQMRVSGRYSTAVRAVRDIWNGAQITVSYGKDWKAGNLCFCEICQEPEAHGPQGQ